MSLKAIHLFASNIKILMLKNLTIYMTNINYLSVTDAKSYST